MRAAWSAAGGMLLAGMLLAAPAHGAQGVSLSWDRCQGDGGTQNRTFACDTNAGAEVLVCSFLLDAPVPQVTGNEVTIDVLSQADPLPAWWLFRDPGTCRQNSLGMNTVANPSDLVCVDWAAGHSVGGVGAYSTEHGTIDPGLASRHRRIKIALAVALEDIADLVADTEYFSCNVTINHAKTVGDPACAGCAGSVCMLLTSIKVTTAVLGNDVSITVPASPGSYIVQWQGAGADCNLVPIKRTTWGEMKGLYR